MDATMLWPRIKRLENEVFSAPPKSYAVTTETVEPDNAVIAVMDTFFKVSNDTPNIDGWTLTLHYTTGESDENVLQAGVNFTEMDGLAMAEVVVVAYKAGAEIDGVVIPEAGVYMLRPGYMKEQGALSGITLAEPTETEDGVTIPSIPDTTNNYILKSVAGTLTWVAE